MSPTVLAYEVWFSTDDDDGAVTVVIAALERTGQKSLVADRRFAAWATWPDVAAWIWQRLSTPDRPSKARVLVT